MEATEQELYHVDSPVLRDFIAAVQRAVVEEPDAGKRVQTLRAPFLRLLDDQSWLPEAFTRPDAEGGMGGGIGVYLLYRSADRDLTLMSLALPAGSATPVHDHLAWGLVGLYRGEQIETYYHRLDSGGDEGEAELVETERRRLGRGEFYDLLPPEGDIHRVETLGIDPSVSLHLLGNDVGCVWRHRYEPEEHHVHRFRSGYSNEPCPEDEAG